MFTRVLRGLCVDVLLSYRVMSVVVLCTVGPKTVSETASFSNLCADLAIDPERRKTKVPDGEKPCVFSCVRKTFFGRKMRRRENIQSDRSIGRSMSYPRHLC